MCHGASSFLSLAIGSYVAPNGDALKRAPTKSKIKIAGLKNRPLQLDVADLHRGVILTVAARNLVLIGLLELENGDLFRAALRNNFAGDGGFGGIVAVQHLFLVCRDCQNRTKSHFFAHVTADAFDPNGVAGRDAILLSPGLDDGVHRSSEPTGKP